MMYQVKKLPYNYVPELGLQILELPYVKEELSMLILLPQVPEDGSDPLLKVQDTRKHDTQGWISFISHQLWLAVKDQMLKSGTWLCCGL